jgi:hypothetical protein
MKNMEKEKFEESLKNAFDGAEISPSDKVWTNIELGLEKAKGGDLKRRLMFYQMLAAASVVFAMAIGGAGYYYSLNQKQSAPNNVAMETPRPSDTKGAPEKSVEEKNPAVEDNNAGAAKTEQQTASNSDKAISPAIKDNDALSGNNQEVADNQHPLAESKNSVAPIARVQPESKTDDGSDHPQDPRDDGAVLISDANTASALPEVPREFNQRDLPPLYTPRKIELTIQTQKQEVDPVKEMLATLEQREKELQGEEKNEKNSDSQNENLWTSIGFAAGSFSSLQSSYSPAPVANSYAMSSVAAPIVDQETKASGYSYSMGVNMGTKISERWVLQGGVNYLTHASEYTANNAVVARDNFQQRHFRAASTSDLVNSNEAELNNKIVHSAPYNVNNSMRYLSIPLQAGYLLVNRTFGLQLNAGVATDLFLQNTIRADSDQMDKTSQSGGSDSPYRSVNLSGLFGTELSYRFSRHYRVSLNPGIRYPFNTIYKSELGVQSTPLTFDVGLRFRYIFH